jgi:hypothetical protein
MVAGESLPNGDKPEAPSSEISASTVTAPTSLESAHSEGQFFTTLGFQSLCYDCR